MGQKVRLDKLLVDRGLAPSRHRAREQIEAGDVLVDGVPTTRPDARVDLDRSVRLVDRGAGPAWASRGALKLEPVLSAFGVVVAGRVCADLGASTGGFTDVLLRAGALRVHAVDVGKGLLHERIAADPRVVVHDGVNARHLEALPEPVSLVVADLAFISLTRVLPAIRRLLSEGGEAVVMVKPQFEVGPQRVGSGGLVRSEADRASAVAGVSEAARALGFEVRGGMDSPVAGARSGNVEHFLHLFLPRVEPAEPDVSGSG